MSAASPWLRILRPRPTPPGSGATQPGLGGAVSAAGESVSSGQRITRIRHRFGTRKLPQATRPENSIANPLKPGRSIAAAAAILLLSGATPALASSGGTSAPGGGPPGTPTPTGVRLPSAAAGRATTLTPQTLQAPVGGAVVGAPTTIRGRLRTRDRNCPVLLEYFDPTHGWKTAAAGRTDSTGAFLVVLRPLHIGRFMFRATTPKAAAAAATSMTPIEIYRSVVATIFGAGDYGSRTACGQVLTPGLLGVAHRTLPCGTPVDITYGSLTITVPVIDRGPFVDGVSYDLTTATAAALGINETAQIGAVAIRTAASPSR